MSNRKPSRRAICGNRSKILRQYIIPIVILFRDVHGGASRREAGVSRNGGLEVKPPGKCLGRSTHGL